jgi:hypothetical protein
LFYLAGIIPHTFLLTVSVALGLLEVPVPLQVFRANHDVLPFWGRTRTGNPLMMVCCNFYTSNALCKYCRHDLV